MLTTSIFRTALAVSAFFQTGLSAKETPLKPRILVLSDITSASWEPDDMQSLVHLFASADLFEIEGIISCTGWSIVEPQPLETYHFYDVIDRYESDLPNLAKRSGQVDFNQDETRQETGYWPSADYLRSTVHVGLSGRGMKWVGDGKATNGSDWIIKVVDEDDDRPVYVGIWGGGNTLAQAIWDVRRTRNTDEFNKFLSKIRVYAITDQDRDLPDPYEGSAQYWLRKEFPDLFYIFSVNAWPTYANTIKYTYWNSTYTTEIQGKGALGDKYPTWRWTVEGDTPSWLYVWPGLNDPEDPTQSSYAGRFSYGLTPDNETTSYTDNGDLKNSSVKAVSDTLLDQIHDFVSRMDWAAEGKGNRNPSVVINGISGYEPVNIAAKAGSRVHLTTEGSRDPDGNKVAYYWSHDDGTGYGKSVNFSKSEGTDIVVSVPRAAKGKKIHVTIRALDDGTPNLASYRRVILDVR